MTEGGASSSLGDSPSDRALPVTVLMGVFNARAHIAESIDSILGQSFADFEFLIIDDGSTDGTIQIVSEYAAADRRIRFVRNAINLGLGALLRSGVEQARGEFVARMDADDIAHPDRLRRQLEYFATHPGTDVIGSYALDVTEDGTVLRERRVPVPHEKIAELVWTCPFLHPTVMFRKESILRVGSYAPIRRRQDYDLWFRCVAGGLRLANIPEPLLRYRFSEGTVKRKHFRSMWEQVKIGLRGCRLVRAPPHVYLATCAPLVEAAMPDWLRLKVASLKARIDPRRRS